MEKLKALLTSKKFWTLIAAIVAALAAFFTTSCTGYLKLQREGVHHDTVRYEQIIKHKNYSAWLSHQTNRSSCIHPTTSFVCSSVTACHFLNSGASISSYLIFPPPIVSVLRLIPSISTSLIISTTLNRNCLEQITPLFISSSQEKKSGSICLALILISFPLSRVSPACDEERRRGGRKGRPRPKIRNIPLGGSHL